MDEYEAVVYDLDGTLVRLDVDWDAVHAAVVERLDEHEVDVGDRDLWDILDVAAERGVKDVVEETIAAFEHEGAKTSRRLPLADELPHGVPVAVCSLNCEAACRVALERHDLGGHVDAVVGRDTVARHKPNPEPLLYAIESVGAHPERTLFVGDSDSDREAAAAAGTAFEFVAARTAEAPPEGEN
ncbi:phosphoglycolate phosphatase [Halobacteriales archaeon QS_4_66_20]|nr:MAG: phosphoglycolate phosphatase [Halobacteriales archaeon QS_4_66_20]